MTSILRILSLDTAVEVDETISTALSAFPFSKQTIHFKECIFPENFNKLLVGGYNSTQGQPSKIEKRLLLLYLFLLFILHEFRIGHREMTLKFPHRKIIENTRSDQFRGIGSTLKCFISIWVVLL